MEKKNYDLVIVGDGLMANILLFKYFKQFPNHKVLKIVAGDLAAPISEISTAVVARRNTQSGLSELGDKLVQGHESFLSYFSSYSGRGIEQCEHGTWCSSNSEQADSFKKRFPECKLKDDYYCSTEQAYLFYPKIFLDELRNSFAAYSLEIKNDFILKQDMNGIEGQYGSYSGKIIFLALGPYAAKLKKIIKYPVDLKEVRGSYLKFEYESEKSFSYTIDGKNFIYRKNTKELIFGNSQFEGTINSQDYEELTHSYQSYLSKIPWKLPAVGTAIYCSGIRSKASKRLPHWGENEYGHYYATGFWKNGYTLSFLAADQLVSSWSKTSVS